MGKRGPRKEPAELQAAKGNPSHRPLNIIDPIAAANDPAAGAPTMPTWLPAESQTLWRELAQLLAPTGMLRKYDRIAFEMICYVYSEWRAAVIQCEEIGRIDVSDKGYRYVTAEHVAERQLRQDLLRAIADFGLTPSARSGLGIRLDTKTAGLAAWRAKQQAAQQKTKPNEPTK